MADNLHTQFIYTASTAENMRAYGLFPLHRAVRIAEIHKPELVGDEEELLFWNYEGLPPGYVVYTHSRIGKRLFNHELTSALFYFAHPYNGIPEQDEPFLIACVAGLVLPAHCAVRDVTFDIEPGLKFTPAPTAIPLISVSVLLEPLRGVGSSD